MLLNTHLFAGVFLALLVALVVSFLASPIVKAFAYKVGAVDVPKDNRRMHHGTLLSMVELYLSKQYMTGRGEMCRRTENSRPARNPCRRGHNRTGILMLRRTRPRRYSLPLTQIGFNVKLHQSGVPLEVQRMVGVAGLQRRTSGEPSGPGGAALCGEVPQAVHQVGPLFNDVAPGCPDGGPGRKRQEVGEGPEILLMGLDIQMLLYLFALQNEGKAYFQRDVVPAGVLYLPARDDILAQERNITSEKLAQERAKALRRSGLLLNEPEVLRAMRRRKMRPACPLCVRWTSPGFGRSVRGSPPRSGVRRPIWPFNI